MRSSWTQIELVGANPVPSAGGEPPAGRRHEHQDCRFWLQQRVHPGWETGHFLWFSSVRRSRTLPGNQCVILSTFPQPFAIIFIYLF